MQGFDGGVDGAANLKPESLGLWGPRIPLLPPPKNVDPTDAGPPCGSSIVVIGDGGLSSSDCERLR